MPHKRLNVETKMIRTLLGAHPEDKSFTYCVKETQTCRSLVLLRNTKSFYNSFYSKERGVCAVEYYILNSDGTFSAYLDETCASKPVINFADRENMRLRVSFDQLGFPTVHNTLLRRHGTSEYAIADLTYSKNLSRISGITFNFKDSNFRGTVDIVYLRKSSR